MLLLEFGSSLLTPKRKYIALLFSTVKFTEAPGYGSGIRMNQKAWNGSGSCEYGSE
jgi:hypothetical protein